MKQTLIQELSRMPSVRFGEGQSSAFLNIENDCSGFSLHLDSGEVTGFQWVLSPFGEDCLQLFLKNDGFLIISPNDFVFDVQQEGIIQVQNLPPVVSVRELVYGFEDYCANPSPSNNYDENLGWFYFHLYLFKAAEKHGISVPMMNELIRIGKQNNVWMQE